MRAALRQRVRGLAKSSVAAGMHWAGLDELLGARRGLQSAPLVLGYHRVVEDFDRSAQLSISPMLTSAHSFEQHLDWVGKHYQFVSLDELALMLEGRLSHSKPVAAITFDDGYQDVYWNAFPILKRKGIPAAVFVVTNLIGSQQLQVHDELYLLLSAALAADNTAAGNVWLETATNAGLDGRQTRRLISYSQKYASPFAVTRAILESLDQSGISAVLQALRKRASISAADTLKDFQALDWHMLREMMANGVTVGSHTKSHVLLANEPADVVKEEVEGSRRELERQLGVSIDHFAYPDGSFDANAIAAVARAGYRTAHTICGHRDPDYPLLTISRRVMWQNTCVDGFGRFSPAVLNCQVNGIFDPASKCHRQHWA